VTVPIPTPILRLIHRDSLEILLRRGGLHAPLATPDDGLSYRTIHNTEIQLIRHVRQIPCGARGAVHNYVPFYFGYLSPMMLQLKTGRVAGYSGGQEPLIYLVTSAQTIEGAGIPFVFSDGHGIAAYTHWYDDLNQLGQVDWGMVNQRYWKDTDDDMDRQRRKQAEFLVHEFCPWSLIKEIAVLNQSAKMWVENILSNFDAEMNKPVAIRPGWYYY
jgi:hypothetical protein